jgi:hypothetical protein
MRGGTLLVSKKDWRALPVDKWTVTTFRHYLFDRHSELYGIKYVTRNHAVEGRMLKNMIAEEGPEVTKRFIDACLAEYKPTPAYPGVSFAFMYSFMRARVLPRVLAEMKREQQARQVSAGLSDEQADHLIDLL